MNKKLFSGRAKKLAEFHGRDRFIRTKSVVFCEDDNCLKIKLGKNNNPVETVESSLECFLNALVNRYSRLCSGVIPHKTGEENVILKVGFKSVAEICRENGEIYVIPRAESLYKIPIKDIITAFGIIIDPVYKRQLPPMDLK